MGHKVNFYSYSPAEFAAYLVSFGFKKFRAKQVWDFVYDKKIFEPMQMSNIGENLQKFLQENVKFYSGELVQSKNDEDSTKKFLFKLEDGLYVESVLLEAPCDDSQIRKTLCLSTQVGCVCGCKFCASALNGFKRNLTDLEIVSQALQFVKKDSKDRAFEFENIVVMGMGEPLYNYENLMKALSVFNSPEKFKFGARRITVSTSGIADKLNEIAISQNNFPYRLAISLHAINDDMRNEIMPINKKYNIETLLHAAKKFSERNTKMITLEYILIENFNDKESDAFELASIAKYLNAHVNLIPYNKVESLNWKTPSRNAQMKFSNILKNKKINSTLRRQKGDNINAACGQLVLKQG